MIRILIVDDDVAFCKMLDTFLTKRGYKTTTAFSAESAIRKIDESDFEIVLTDVRLPEKDGTEVLKYGKEKMPRAQFILMTGYAEVSLAVDAIKKGAFDYISKPINPDKMLE